MDEEKKKQINEAIAVLREECKNIVHATFALLGKRLMGKIFAQNLGLGKILSKT